MINDGEQRPHILYRFYNSAEDLLYIGITMDPPSRFRQHRDVKAWWTEVTNVRFEHFPSRAAVLAAECAAIEAEQPLFNVAHMTTVCNGEDCNCADCQWLDNLSPEQLKARANTSPGFQALAEFTGDLLIENGWTTRERLDELSRRGSGASPTRRTEEHSVACTDLPVTPGSRLRA